MPGEFRMIEIRSATLAGPETYPLTALRVTLALGDIGSATATLALGEELGGGRHADRFTVRCWSREQVLQAAAKAGLQLQQELSPQLGDSGSAYLLLSCAPAATQTPSA